MLLKTSRILLCTLALVACEKKDSSSPDDGSSKKESGNLCVKYSSCNECISGQIAAGKSEGAAETQCGAAVTGCWTTWEKPVKCGGKTHDKKE